jgi:ornithine cyclodeaminase/alanine dehydrogenase-like protein (mu-crystallin family)
LGDRVFNLPDVLLGRVHGRTSAKEITCTSNEGTGVQFAAVALKVYQEAKARGLGRKLPLEWFLQDVTN